ncbi:MAG: branched-chain amino acid ABC transporter permease [Dehalococcoidia bacterium]
MTGPGIFLAFAALAIYSAVDHDTRKFFVTGVVVASVYALGAIGLNLIYGVLKFGHFAQGDSMMLAAYLAFFVVSGSILGERRDTQVLPVHLDDLPGSTDPIWELTFGYSLLLGIIGAGLLMSGILVLLDRLIYRRLRERRGNIVIFSIASLGLALAIRSSMLIFWGPNPRSYVEGIHPALHLPFDIVLKGDQIFIIVTAVVMAAAVYSLLMFSKLGKAMRAVADNPELALISGINTDQIFVWTWVIAGWLIAVAGVLLALQAQLNPNLGFIIVLPLFASAILGGIGSPLGAIGGALIVGITQEVSVGLEVSVFGEHLLPLAAGYKFSVAVVLLILILLVRPQGLFGREPA